MNETVEREPAGREPASREQDHQEKWREDFPVEWVKDQYTTRREFTKFLIAISGAAMVGNGLIALQKARPRIASFPRVEVCAIDAIPVDGVKLFRYPTEKNPAILIRLAEDRFVAYLQACTHLSCPVTYSARHGRIECPCHHGVFEAESGRVLSGPPPRPLPKIRLVREGGRLYAEGMEDV